MLAEVSGMEKDTSGKIMCLYAYGVHVLHRLVHFMHVLDSCQ